MEPLWSPVVAIAGQPLANPKRAASGQTRRKPSPSVATGRRKERNREKGTLGLALSLLKLLADYASNPQGAQTP
jgi:hypothetical protein